MLGTYVTNVGQETHTLISGAASSQQLIYFQYKKGCVRVVDAISFQFSGTSQFTLKTGV